MTTDLLKRITSEIDSNRGSPCVRHMRIYLDLTKRDTLVTEHWYLVFD